MSDYSLRPESAGQVKDSPGSPQDSPGSLSQHRQSLVDPQGTPGLMADAPGAEPDSQTGRSERPGVRLSRLAPLAPSAWLRFDVVERILPAGITDVLEIGCGRGAFAAR